MTASHQKPWGSSLLGIFYPKERSLVSMAVVETLCRDRPWLAVIKWEQIQIRAFTLFCMGAERSVMGGVV